MDEKKENSINGIKDSLENLLGAKTVLKIKKPSKEDKDKEVFEKIMSNIELLEARSFFLEEQVKINFNDYNNLFFDVIDDLILLHFGPKIAELIDFYLYDRYNLDGSKKQLLDEANHPIPLNTSAELWDLIQLIKNQEKKKK